MSTNAWCYLHNGRPGSAGERCICGRIGTYTPPPHMDAKALIERAAAQLRKWHEVYGKHNPAWLPPAGDVRWLEDAAAYLGAHTLPAVSGVDLPDGAQQK